MSASRFGKAAVLWSIFLQAQEGVVKRMRRESRGASLKVSSCKRMFGETELAARVRVCFAAKHLRASRGQLPRAGRD